MAYFWLAQLKDNMMKKQNNRTAFEGRIGETGLPFGRPVSQTYSLKLNVLSCPAGQTACAANFALPV